MKQCELAMNNDGDSEVKCVSLHCTARRQVCVKGVSERGSVKGKISFFPGLFKYRVRPGVVNVA